MIDFRKFIADFAALVAAGVATTALVLVSYLSDMVPPWPDTVVELTGVFQIIVLVFVYQFCKNYSKQKINSRMVFLLTVAVFFLFLYLATFSLLVYDVPNEPRNIRGVFCTPKAIQIYSESCPILSTKQIGDAGYIPSKLWTPVGILVSRLGLFGIWMTFFTSLVSVFALFVSHQRRQE